MDKRFLANVNSFSRDVFIIFVYCVSDKGICSVDFPSPSFLWYGEESESYSAVLWGCSELLLTELGDHVVSGVRLGFLHAETAICAVSLAMLYTYTLNRLIKVPELLCMLNIFIYIM